MSSLPCLPRFLSHPHISLLTMLIALLGVAAVPSTAQAQACNLHAACPNGDGTRTSSLTVIHATGAQYTQGNVEPATGETFQVTATYRLESAGATACACDARTVQATVDVDWNGSQWVANCTAGCGGAIVGVAVCGSLLCSTGMVDHSAIYELIVDLVANAAFACGVQPINGALETVNYETTSVDDGDQIDTSSCGVLGSVSPTSQTWTANDNGAFECAFTCAGATGPSITILYQ